VAEIARQPLLRIRKLYIEKLEKRECPAFTCAFTETGILILGSNGNDQLLGFKIVGQTLQIATTLPSGAVGFNIW